MYNELTYVVEAFKNNFTDRKVPMALYGLGLVTKGLLENIKDYNIVGLMDGKKKAGEQWGIRIIDQDGIISLNVKIIVVIAKQPAIPVIFYRIKDFCLENGIDVYDVNGICLAEMYSGFENVIPYFDINMERLKEEVDRHDVISFDIFDTLLVRCVLYPKDVFRYLERQLKASGLIDGLSFYDNRVKAEDNLLKDHGHPNIYEIYDEFQALTGISDEKKRELIKREIEAEIAVIRPRKTMLRLFNEIKKGKRIYLVSDMYLPQEILTDILDKNGYQDYVKILVSCDCKKSKREGLFDNLKKWVGKGEKILHIGDNQVADIIAPQESGIDTFYIMSEREMLANSGYRGLMDQVRSVSDSLLAGRFIVDAFDDPFILYGTRGKLRISDVGQYVCLFIAPMVFYYSIWLVEKIREMACDYVLYTSRDGFLIKKIIEIIKKKCDGLNIPDGIYFYTSRRACLAATTYSFEDIRERLLPCYAGDIYSLFLERLGVEIDEKAKRYSADDRDEILHYAEKYRDSILEHCREEREGYLAYIKESGIEAYKRLAMIDLVAKGTVQNELGKLLSVPELIGMYFFRTNVDDSQSGQNMKYCSLYKPEGKYASECPNVYRSYRQMELILTSDEPTFHSVDQNCKKRFMKELRSKDQIKNVRIMQETIIEYVEDMVKLLVPGSLKDISGSIPDRILGFSDNLYSQIDVRELSNMILYSEMENLKFTVTDNL